MNFYDCNSTQGVHYYIDNGKYWNFDPSYTAVTAGARAYYGGIITGSKGASHMITIGGGEVRFYGGSLVGNTTTENTGSVLYVSNTNRSRFYVRGGAIVGNYGNGYGSTLYFSSNNEDSVFEMTGGVVGWNRTLNRTICRAYTQEVYLSNVAFVANQGVDRLLGVIELKANLFNILDLNSDKIKNGDVQNCIFADNTEINNYTSDGTTGAVIRLYYGRFQFINCKMYRNQTSNCAVGFYIHSDDLRLSLRDCEIKENISRWNLKISSSSYVPGVIGYKKSDIGAVNLSIAGNTEITGNRLIDNGIERECNVYLASNDKMPFPFNFEMAPFSGKVGVTAATLPTQGQELYLFRNAFLGLGLPPGKVYSDIPGYSVVRYELENPNLLGNCNYTIKITELESLSATAPTKTAYEAYENFDGTGMTVTAHYKTNAPKVVTDYTVSDGTRLQAGQTSVTISYTEDGTTVTTAVPIMVAKKRIVKPDTSAVRHIYDGSEQTYLPIGYDSETMTIANNVQTNANEAGYAVTVGLKDPSNCEWTTEGEAAYAFVIEKAEPAVTPKVSATEILPGNLPEIALTAGDTAGTIAWDEGQDWTTAGQRAYGWTFVPTDGGNYQKKTGTVTIEVAKTRYTLTLDGNGGTFGDGSGRAEIEEEEGAALSGKFPAVPLKRGYTFAGWTKEGTVSTLPTTMPAESRTYKASWTVVAYTITYYLGGGSFDESGRYPSTYTIEDEIVFGVPKRTGYKFSGWNDEGGNRMEGVNGNTGNLILTATWDKELYAIELCDEDGTIYGKVTKGYGDRIAQEELERGIPEKAGWLFKGWKENIPEKMPAQDLRISAVWYKVLTVTNKNQEFDFVEDKAYGEAPEFEGRAEGKAVRYEWDNGIARGVGTHRIPVRLTDEGRFYVFEDGTRETTITIVVNRVTSTDPGGDADGDVSGDFGEEVRFKIVEVKDGETVNEIERATEGGEYELNKAYRFETNYEGILPVQLKLKYGADPDLRVAILTPDGRVEEIEYRYAVNGSEQYLIFDTDARNVFMILRPKTDEKGSLTWLWIALGSAGGALLIAGPAVAIFLVRRKMRRKRLFERADFDEPEEKNRMRLIR